jgi:hypothetical protein
MVLSVSCEPERQLDNLIEDAAPFEPAEQREKLLKVLKALDHSGFLRVVLMSLSLRDSLCEERFGAFRSHFALGVASWKSSPGVELNSHESDASWRLEVVAAPDTSVYGEEAVDQQNLTFRGLCPVCKTELIGAAEHVVCLVCGAKSILKLPYS